MAKDPLSKKEFNEFIDNLEKFFKTTSEHFLINYHSSGFSTLFVLFYEVFMSIIAKPDTVHEINLELHKLIEKLGPENKERWRVVQLMMELEKEMADKGYTH